MPPISQVCTAQEYYEELLRAYVRWHRLFPYHLADYVCRVMRVTPFRYYTDVLYTVVRDEKSYDRLPNFTAADILRHVGIGRNEYISLMNHCKGRKGALGALWKVNKGAIARELLPAVPLDPKLEPWWRACCVNIGETEFRELTVDEVAVVKTAALPEGARVGEWRPGPS